MCWTIVYIFVIISVLENVKEESVTETKQEEHAAPIDINLDTVKQEDNTVDCNETPERPASVVQEIKEPESAPIEVKDSPKEVIEIDKVEVEMTDVQLVEKIEKDNKPNIQALNGDISKVNGVKPSHIMIMHVIILILI